MPSDPSIDRTLSVDDGSLQTSARGARTITGLAILWSRDEPDRAGELFAVPRQRGPWTLGRRHPEGEADPRFLKPIRQRPGGAIPRPALASRRISRRQLSIRPEPGGLVLENVGGASLRVNDEPVDRASVIPGDLVELHRELVLLCVERPESMPAVDRPLHPFGAPDALGLVGEGPAIWDLRARLALVGATAGHALIRGPSGAGKELAARAVHALSNTGREMVSRNAATFPEGLLDAELFGNARNYPNPGSPARLGAIGEADGTTLFLDEIGEISHEMQAHLLRALDSGEYQRLGEDRRRRSRFRLIGATNRPLDALKHDFLARLSRRIELPGLDARREDVPLLARHLLARMHDENPGLFPPEGPPRMHPRLVRGLVMKEYTTHTRELNGLLWRAAERWKLDGGGKYMDLEIALPPRRAREQIDPSALTRDDVLAAYRTCGGVQARVVTYLGLKSRFQLNRLEKRLGITPADRSGDTT